MIEPRPLPQALTVYEFPPGELEQLQELKAWAMRPENVWKPSEPPPGNLEDRRRLLRALERGIVGWRAVVISVVFTVTRQPFGLCRHASIALSAKGGEPAGERPGQGAMAVICKLLGFEGDYRSWILQDHPGTAALGILEPLEKT